MPNSFGHFFKIHTFGESHGQGVGVVIDGCPPGYLLNLRDLQKALDRRRPNQSKLTTARGEKDQVECISGLNSRGITLGTPLCLLVYNRDKRPDDYADLAKVFRPSHSDFTYAVKYGVEQPSGGGRASARETLARVAAGEIARQVLHYQLPKLKVCCFVEQVHKIKCHLPREAFFTQSQIDQYPVRCPDPMTAKKMATFIEKIKELGDSAGGIIRCAVSSLPAGIGEPVFRKLESELAQAILSIPAAKGIEIGDGFAGTECLGSEQNDSFIVTKRAVSSKTRSNKLSSRITVATNHSGGIQAGISNGADIFFRVAFKPVSTIMNEQQSVDRSGKAVRYRPKSGRHDPCVLPRAVPIVEAMTWLVLLDGFSAQNSRENLRGPRAQSI